MKKRFSASEVADWVGGTVSGNGSVLLSGFAPAASARDGDLTFAENESFLERAEQSAASAILVDGAEFISAKTLIRVPNARIGFARALALFFPEPVFSPGLHPTAVISDSAEIDASAHVGPHCVICDGVKIGRNAVLQSLVHVGAHCSIGESSNIFPNVSIYPQSQIGDRVRIHSGSVIGSDGFGYVLDSGFHRKILQVGHVIIRDDVEIGACVAIDRGALGATEIGKGTKIDNLVQIAHNVVIGEHCIVVAQAGIAGSARLGNYTVVAGQAGIAGHLQIGDRVTISAQSGVMHHVPDGEKWLGSPAQPDRQMKRQLLAMQQLPELIRRVAQLERALAEK